MQIKTGVQLPSGPQIVTNNYAIEPKGMTVG